MCAIFIFFPNSYDEEQDAVHYLSYWCGFVHDVQMFKFVMLNVSVFQYCVALLGSWLAC